MARLLHPEQLFFVCCFARGARRPKERPRSSPFCATSKRSLGFRFATPNGVSDTWLRLSATRDSFPGEKLPARACGTLLSQGFRDKTPGRREVFFGRGGFDCADECHRSAWAPDCRHKSGLEHVRAIVVDAILPRMLHNASK